MDVLTIDGKVMPAVQKMSISHEKIWSKNTGRVADGEMAGDIVAIKDALEVVFCPMSDADAVLLDAAVRQTFFNVTFRSPATGKMETKRMYAGTPAYPVYSYAEGLPRYVGVGVKLIMK